MRYLPVLLFLLAGHGLLAQTCTGGLGDPIIDINFGAGPNFGPALASGITNLQYVTDQCPEDGYYTIASSVNGCFSGTWLNLNSDHTGNPNGYFMLINASYQPSQFFVQTVTGLCAGTTYQFAAWVLNLASHTGQILPNITFSIESTDGTLLDSVHTGNIPVTNPANWTQYGFYFTTPPNVTTVILRMNNNAPGGVGNDLALDDITFRPAGPAMTLAVNGQAVDSITVCANSPQALNFAATVGSCYSSTALQWQESTDNGATWADLPGAVNKAYSVQPGTAGVNLYRITAAQSGNIGLSTCRVASASVTVDVLRIPSPSVTISDSSDAICANTPATFTALSVDGGATPSYQWSLNGSPVSSSGPSYTGEAFADGDQVNVVMTSDAVCVLNPSAVSNTITLAVTPDIVSSVEVTASATTICSDSVVRFAATPFNGGANPAYQWMVNNTVSGADAPYYSSGGLEDGDLVSVVMTGSLRCSFPVSSNIVTMTVYPTPAIVLTPDTVVAPRSSFLLDPLTTGQIAEYAWSPAAGLDNPASPNPVASPDTTTVYQLRVVTPDGCAASAKEIVAVFYDFLMPSAFTPNGDGRNDFFRVPPSIPVTLIRISVYNRLGRLLFAAGNGGAGWDGRFEGRLQPPGTYVWVVEYEDPLTKKQVTRNGTVELIR
ncbi:MAG: gliding motility-associated C-terminal domain-containing protein [Puia sp.]|nr:gliding motility-associated C-terminal domain-containing protein [Puia sp.]